MEFEVLKELEKQTCAIFGVSTEDLKGREKRFPFPDARHYFICKAADAGVIPFFTAKHINVSISTIRYALKKKDNDVYFQNIINDKI